MIEAYFDESYDQGQQHYYAMAGLVGLRESWNRVWGEWDRALDKYRLAVFHAVDCACGRGDFVDLDSTERAAIYRHFLGIIIGSSLVGHATMIPLGLYRQVFPDYAHGSSRDPYFLGFQHCVKSICLDHDISLLPNDEKIAFVFDQNDEVKHRALDLYTGLINKEPPVSYRHRLEGACLFGDKTRIKPLQAADVLAYEYCRHLKEKDENKPARPEWEALSRRFGDGWVVFPAPSQ